MVSYCQNRIAQTIAKVAMTVMYRLTCNQLSNQYVSPPTTQAIAYISFLKITGSSLSSTSLMTPPAAPVMHPIMMATQNGKPHSNVFEYPLY